ncbi:MAG: hypothetical protein ABEK36_06455, partial [Candidatus Aenigmatarchaeota archaeon]
NMEEGPSLSIPYRVLRHPENINENIKNLKENLEEIRIENMKEREKINSMLENEDKRNILAKRVPGIKENIEYENRDEMLKESLKLLMEGREDWEIMSLIPDLPRRELK